jgi:hypothetical protein
MNCILKVAPTIHGEQSTCVALGSTWPNIEPVIGKRTPHLPNRKRRPDSER